jgi:hypothetical protein
MKYLPILLLLSFPAMAFAQSTPVTVTMNGIGEIKLGMKKADVEKLLNQTMKVPNLSKKDGDYYEDTVHALYKGIEVDVIFQKQYIDEKRTDIIVWGVSSKSPLLKTKSGIGIGDDKYKIISTYEGYMIYLMPEYEKDYTVKSKTRSSVWLHGDTGGTMIIFYLYSNKVTSMSVGYDEGN